MAGKRGNSHNQDFYVGAAAEYYSKSYDEWIPCVVSQVKSDGFLQLKHDDGSSLKESADPSLVRLAHAEPQKPPPGKAPNLPRNPSMVGKSGPPVPKGAQSPPRASTPERGHRAPSPALKGAGLGVLGNGNANAKGKGDGYGNVGANLARKPSGDCLGGPKSLPANIAKQGNERGSVAKAPPSGRRSVKEPTFYPGDRAKIKSSGREGVILYCGVPSFSSDETVGMQLDQKRSKADCDGKGPNDERLFRCPAGYGVILPAEDVELIPFDNADALVTVPAPLEKLDLQAAFTEFVGLRTMKEKLTKIKQGVEVQKKREALGVSGGKPLHFLFRGNRGTGMSKTAQILAHLMRDLEVLADGQVLETSRQDILSGSNEVEKQMNQLWKNAGGGMLVVNQVDTLQDRERSRDSDGVEASEFLAKQLTSMNAKSSGESAVPCFPQSVCMVLTCAQDAVLPDALQRCNSLFQVVPFDDYSDDDLVEILVQIVHKRKFELAPKLSHEKLLPFIRDATRRATDPQDKNIHMLRRLVDEAITRQGERAYDAAIEAAATISDFGLTTLTEQDFVDSMTPSRDKSIQDVLTKLDKVVGLAAVKKFINSLYAQLKMEAERRDVGLSVSGGAGSLHMIFSGNPGTGKTTMARIVADLLSAMGLLRKGHVVEADRAALVAGYSGQTALKTKQVVDSAMGGVLFIDEAYALVSEDGKDSFGKEALDTLIKLIEDRREDLVVILAGYPREMERLTSTNPGVKSRFPTHVLFEDYSESELMQIAESMLDKDGFKLSTTAKEALAGLLAVVGKAKGREQGNGRAVRNLLEQARRKMAVRLQGGGAVKVLRSREELETLEREDFE